LKILFIFVTLAIITAPIATSPTAIVQIGTTDSIAVADGFLDPYVDAIVTSQSEVYINGSNAIGAPDGAVVMLFEDYVAGYITLDMGENEEITDGTGFDFEVIASGSNYSVYIGNSLDVTMELLGRGYGNKSFDISSSSYDVVRYIRIQLFIGVLVNIDAIVAINSDLPPIEDDPPDITALEDTEMFLSDNNMTLTWTLSDANPWTYEIFINDTLDETDWWEGESIEYSFEPTQVGFYQVTIIAYDAFGNMASDTVLIEVKSDPVAADNTQLIIIAGAVGAIVFVIVLGFFIYRKK